ncbi:MAG: hypothetical protein EBY18_00430 [Alphaproteobacteria bacterium]|nr:hypothetical protein [Alphaproteobacteria bacterium]
MLTREDLTSERIDQIVADAHKAGYDFFLTSEQRAASLAAALQRYQPGEEAWVFAYEGIAYRLAPHQVSSELAILWNREMLSNVYQARWVPTQLRDGRTVTAVTFVVDTAHCQYCGDLSMERAAHHIAFAEGRRGACRDYLFNTAEHTRSLGIHDPYIEDLMERVATLRGDAAGASAPAAAELAGEA